MKDLLVFLHDADNIKNIRNAAVTGIILADRAFSSCADGTGITAEAADMIHQAGYRAIAKADRLFEQQELDQVFCLTDKAKKEYRCLYCETKASNL